MAEPTMGGELMFPSMYLHNEDLKGRDVNLRIKAIKLEELRLEGGGKTQKYVLYFHKTDKMFVLNKTNSRTIAKLYGGPAEGWVDKVIRLYPTTCRFGKDPNCPCVRIRPHVPDSKRAQRNPSEVDEELDEDDAPPAVDAGDQ